MPVNKVTVGSVISIQAVKPVETTPPIGDLPTQRAQRRDVPITSVQDDRLFVRDSIGSATAEKRLDLDIPNDGLALPACRNDSGVQMGLSFDRPTVLASIDVFSRFADDETIEKSIDQNLRLAEFESVLFKADYDFLMNSLKSQNSELLQPLQDSLNSEEVALEEKLRTLSKISSKGEEISRRLDFIRPENGFRAKIQEQANNLSLRFEESRPSDSSYDLIRNASTSTSVVKRVQKRIDESIFSPYELDLIAKVRAGSALFQDTFTTRDGVRYSYNDLDSLEKTIVCCKVLSKIMAETFTKAKFPGLKSVDLPVSIETSATSDNFIFEFNDTSVSGSAGEQTSDGFVRNNNFDSIISKVSERGEVDIESLNSIRKSYRRAENFLRFKQAVGFDNDACSPQDILFSVMNLIASSFPEYSRGIVGSAANSRPDDYELLDALVMSFGCKSTISDVNLNALWRAIILSSVTDPDYVWGEAEPEVYETRTETKSTTEVDGEVKTIKSNIGSNQKGKGSVFKPEEKDVYYDPLEKRGFVPGFSQKWIGDFLRSQSLSATVKIDPYLNLIFSAELLRNKGIVSTYGVVPSAIPLNSNSYSSEEYFRKALLDCVKTYNSRSYTVGSKILALYNLLIQKFSSAYEVEIQEAEFFIEGRKITKNSILDLVFECLSSFTSWLVAPVFQKESTHATIALFSRRLSRLSKRETQRSTGATPQQAVTGGSARLQNSFSRDSTDTDDYVDLGPSGVPPTREAASESDSSQVDRFGSSPSTPVPRPEDDGGSTPPEDDTLTVHESFRMLKFVKELSNASGGYFSARYVSLGNNTELVSSSPMIDDANSDFLIRKIDLIQITDLLRDYKDVVSDLVTVSSITSRIETAMSDLILLKDESRKLRQSLLNFGVSQRDDVLKCLSVQSTSSALLKNRKRRISSTDIFVNDREREAPELDISATRWFFSSRRFSDYEKSRFVFFGLPQGFTDSLIRQTREVDPETFEIIGDPAPNTTPIYFESWLTSRSVLNSSSIYENRLMRFNPLIHVVQKDKILPDDVLTLGSSLGSLVDRFDIFIYDGSVGDWLLSGLDFDSFEEAVGKLGLTASAGEELVISHVLDSVHKSVVRTLTGLEIDADTLGTHKRAMSVSDAGSVLQLMASDTAGIIPRGSMRAINFLNRNEDGFIESIPFSRLQGRSSDMTIPSDHALLMKFLDTRAFTKGTLSKEVLLPSAFERVYCGIFNPADTSIKGTSAENINISQITIKAIRS